MKYVKTAIGALIGALLVAAIVIIRHLMDDTIKDEDDVQKYLQLHTLASFPFMKQKGEQTAAAKNQNTRHKASKHSSRS